MNMLNDVCIHSEVSSGDRKRLWLPRTSKARVSVWAFGLMLGVVWIVPASADPSSATTWNFSSMPLFLGSNRGPNVMFTLDDSGSMQFELLPDDMRLLNNHGGYSAYIFPVNQATVGPDYYWNSVNRSVDLPGYEDTNEFNYRMRSAHNNKAYYDPGVTYLPWVHADGTLYPNASIACANNNPVDTGKGCRDLTTTNAGAANSNTDSYAYWYRRNAAGVYSWTEANYVNGVTGAAGFWPATYFTFDTTNAGCDGNVSNRNCYDKVEIRSTTPSYTGSAQRTDCAAAPSCSYAEEIQNFANWYTYYRSRVYLARAGVGRAFASLPDDSTSPTLMRVGFGAINEGTHTIDSITSPGTVLRGVRSFSGSNRTAIFDELYQHPIPAAGTPLRKALDDVGQYFQRSDNAGPWADVPGGSGTGAHSACRQSYSILMTDGYWNGAAASTTAATGNVDNTAGTSITNNTPNTSVPSYTYAPAFPYKDEYGDTLADVGMYYWVRDLRTDLANKVRTSVADPAFWQHLTQFTVGLGVNGTLNPAVDLPALTSGTKVWPQATTSTSQQNVDDLWHTAVNGRGRFFSAADPTTFSDALTAVFADIASRAGSAAAVAFNSAQLAAGSRVYQTSFNSSDWSGNVEAIAINADGTLSSTPAWSARDRLAVQNYDTGRRIVTYNPSNAAGSRGVPFRWASLSSTQQTQLNVNPVTNAADTMGSNRVDYLRGRDVSGMRARTYKLGDIIQSGPVYVAGPRGSYDTRPLSEAAAYATFKTTNKTRTPVVYGGANDGMLHAFSASTGDELFAYTPAAVYGKLNKLTSTEYQHKAYVDATPFVGDAYLGGSWKTLLVGGLGTGGQGIYALDITTPPSATATETAVATKVMWEFTDADDEDLGDTHSQPQVVRMNTGDWAVIFGNGYDNTRADSAVSSSGNAVLFIVNAQTGALIKKLDTKLGWAQDPANGSTGRPNGLGSVTPLDYNQDGNVDYIYAGDLFGNLWKFDVSDSNSSNWQVGFGTSSSPLPLFQARSASNGVQPLTVRVEIGDHPLNPTGFMIYFGTGKFLETADNSQTGQITQSFYGIWDKNDGATRVARSDLQQQQITREVTAFSATERIVSDNALDWSTKRGWYLDLVNVQGGNTDNYGERTVSEAQLLDDKIIFSTLIPSSDQCDSTGSGWIMVLNAATGGRTKLSPFDFNNDRAFTSADYVNSDGSGTMSAANGLKAPDGVPQRLGLIIDGDTALGYIRNSNGGTSSVPRMRARLQGRTSWRDQ